MEINELALDRVFWAVVALGGLRYILVCGAAYFGFWVLGKERFKSMRIQKKNPPAGAAMREFGYSMLSNVIFAALSTVMIWMDQLNMTQLYWQIEDRSQTYFILSVAMLIVLHDAYFYFTHWMMHHPKLYKTFHSVHHRSVNPTPWAAFSFNPAEAVVQALFVNIVVMVMPLHPWSLVLWGFFMMGMNVVGHLGYECFPRWTPLKVLNTSTHHNMHHKYFNCNYGLYFNWWDRLFRTNHKFYEQQFAVIKDRKFGSGVPEVETEDVSEVANN